MDFIWEGWEETMKRGSVEDHPEEPPVFWRQDKITFVIQQSFQVTRFRDQEAL